MRKIRSKLKRKTNNQKWKRGQSSTSNPTKKVYRNRARFNNVSGTCLTLDGVGKLNQIPRQFNDMDDNESMYSNAPTTTVRSFLSSFSTNTNASFSKLLDCDSLNERQKEMVAVLAASTETIKEEEGNETSTEYFLAFINSLAITNEVNRADPIIGLMKLVIKAVPAAVMQDKFTLCRTIFLKLMNSFEKYDRHSGLIDVIYCTSTLLSTQDFGKWNSNDMKPLLHALLAFTTHSKPKIRKSAVSSVSYFLSRCKIGFEQISYTTKVPFEASKQVTLYCIQHLSANELNGNPVTVLHTLGLVEKCFPFLDANDIKLICECLLSLSSTSNPLIRMHCYQAFYTLFDSEECQLSDVMAARLITAVFGLQPDSSDVRQTVAWITVLKKGYIFIVKKNPILCSDLLTQFVHLLVIELWSSNHLEIRTTITNVLKDILKDAILKLVNIEVVDEKLIEVLNYLLKALKNPFALYQKDIIVLYSTVYEVYGKRFSNELKETLKLISNKYSTDGDDRREIEICISSAIKNLNIGDILEAIPLANKNLDISIDNSWILPLLRENLRNSSLEYFYTDIVPLASICLKKWKHFEAIGKPNESHIYELLCCQLWGLFPGFCRQPKDIEKFSMIARTVGTILSENLYLRAPILDGFKELIPSVISFENPESVGKYARNYLPILFNLYITKPKGSYENDLRVNVLGIIKLFLLITPNDALNEMFNSAYNRLKTTNVNDFAYNMIFDIIECFAIHLSPDQMIALYEDYVKPIFNTTEITESKNVSPKIKKGYRIICCILSNENENCKKFISQKKNDLEHLLMSTGELNGDNVKLTRLKCLKYLLDITKPSCDSSFVKQCISEVILCFSNNPDKSNQLCTDMIKTIGTTFNDANKFDEFVHLMLFGFASEDSDLVIKTIWSINYIFKFFGGIINDETLHLALENIYTSVQSKNRIEAKSALCTLFTCIKCIPRESLNKYVNTLVATVSKMVPDTKRFCRLSYSHLLKKLCQYYTVQQITKIVPGDDIITHKLLKKIRKGLNKSKTGNKNNALVDDEMKLESKLKSISINDVLKDSDNSEVDTDDEDSNEKIEKNDKIYIKENAEKILDLTDINAISKISFKNKKSYCNNENVKDNVAKNVTFRTAPDGRLIIEEPKTKLREIVRKSSCFTKRARESDDSESEKEEHTQTQSKGIHRMARSYKANKTINNNKKMRKETSLGKKHIQPYAYLPFGSSKK
ncbi:RRP12-like protein [Culicoides brevitarsis]|uniref:RRP12-like protein n=1 Tax=Culicoides brevitarsis TaxID=469753 RepID=UPI00307B5C94